MANILLKSDYPVSLDLISLSFMVSFVELGIGLSWENNMQEKIDGFVVVSCIFIVWRRNDGKHNHDNHVQPTWDDLVGVGRVVGTWFGLCGLCKNLNQI